MLRSRARRGRISRARRREERHQRIMSLRVTETFPNEHSSSDAQANDSFSVPHSKLCAPNQIVHPESFCMNECSEAGHHALVKSCASALSRLETCLHKVSQSTAIVVSGSHNHVHHTIFGMHSLTNVDRLGVAGDIIQLRRKYCVFERMIDRMQYSGKAELADQLMCMKRSVCQKKKRARKLWREVIGG
mmetsp:Transcript_55770/g.167127  ORF Transcript_55770/g.167127 Transcript_55770/m.167127 type:complete len:189 (-) Transcript_55770:1437-2003(-)